MLLSIAYLRKKVRRKTLRMWKRVIAVTKNKM